MAVLAVLLRLLVLNILAAQAELNGSGMATAAAVRECGTPLLAAAGMLAHGRGGLGRQLGGPACAGGSGSSARRRVHVRPRAALPGACRGCRAPSWPGWAAASSGSGARRRHGRAAAAVVAPAAARAALAAAAVLARQRGGGAAVARSRRSGTARRLADPRSRLTSLRAAVDVVGLGCRGALGAAGMVGVGRRVGVLLLLVRRHGRRWWAGAAVNAAVPDSCGSVRCVGIGGGGRRTGRRVARRTGWRARRRSPTA